MKTAPWNTRLTARHQLLGGLCLGGGFVHSLGLGGELRAELLDTARFNDARLSAGVEGVAGRRGIDLEKGIGLAVDINGFLGLNGRGDDKGLIDGNVEERDLAVLRENALLHFILIPS